MKRIWTLQRKQQDPKAEGDKAEKRNPAAKYKTVRAAREKPPGRLFHERRMRAWQ